ncbi:MAG: hypothetical protein HQL33_09745 [Alphaproteobacteria bacterium]|nr:hypothetical protein [Alphaproteobacteria bacterium]MBF0130265.1 hypothetical protein [Alphaproteobacteria bacterium]
MAKEKNEIIADIRAYIAKFGGRSAEWFVGTSVDAKSTLYKMHKLKQGDPGLVRTAHTEIQAADVVTTFVNTYKTKGSADGVVEPDRLQVYAYKLQPYTKP